MDWATIIASATVSLISVLGAGGVLASRIQRRNIESQTGVNEAERLLKQSQIEINLSQEVRQLLQVYSDDSKKARQEAEKANSRAEKAEGRVDFLIDYFREQGYAIPEFPSNLQ